MSLSPISLLFHFPLSFPYLYPDHNLDSLFPITFTSVSFLSLASRELDFLVCLLIIWMKNVIQNKHFYWKNKSKSNQQISNYSLQNVLRIFVDMAWVQFHQHVHLRLLRRTDPKSTRKQSSHQCLFTLLGSVHTKASGKTLVKLTSGVNFINVLCTPFSSKFF